MMVEEQRLAAWLDEMTPEPPRAIAVDDIAARVRQRRGLPWWVPALAAAAVVVLVAALAFGLRGSDHAAPPAVHTGSTTTAPAPVPVPQRVLPIHVWHARTLSDQTLANDALAALDGRLYGLVPYSTFGPVSTLYGLTRLDLTTGRPLGPTFQGGISTPLPPVASAGLVWTVAQLHGAGSRTQTNTVYGLDPNTLAVRVKAGLPRSSTGDFTTLAAAPDGTVVVGLGRRITFVGTHGTLRSFTADAEVDGLAVSPDGSRLYVAGAEAGAGGRLETLDPTTGARLAGAVETGPISGLQATASGVWDTWTGGHGAGIEFRPAHDLASPVRPEGGGSGGGSVVAPTLSGGVAWLGGDSTIGCADPDTGRSRAHVSLGTTRAGEVVGYLSGLQSLGAHVYATFDDIQSRGGLITHLVELTPPTACFK